MDEYKKSEDLEIYEMDYKSNKELQDVCNLKQPVLFKLDKEEPTFFKEFDIIGESKTLVNVKDKEDIDNGNSIILPYESAKTLMTTDTKSRFYSERNDKIANETSFDFNRIDDHLKPNLVIHTKYELMFGSKGAHTVMRYHTDHRKFLCVRKGRIHVKMTPWRSSKYLHITKDYVNYDFRSLVDVWDAQPKYLNDMEKLKFLEFDVEQGYVLNIPPFWFYSIKYSSDDATEVFQLTYNTPMNVASNLPFWSMYYLQQQNLKRIFLLPFKNAIVTEHKNEINISKEKQQKEKYDKTPRDKVFEEQQKDKTEKKKEKEKSFTLPE
jgi:hypothetical protein